MSKAQSQVAAPSKVAVLVDWYAIIGGENMVQILTAQEIIENAHKAAEAGLPIASCPYPVGTPHANRWQLAFYAREKELRAEVEA